MDTQRWNGRMLIVLAIATAVGCGTSTNLRGTLGDVTRMDRGRLPLGLRAGDVVEGRDCTWIGMGLQARVLSLDHAMEHALDGTGSQTLLNVEVRFEGEAIELCLVVRGRPLIVDTERAPPAETSAYATEISR